MGASCSQGLSHALSSGRASRKPCPDVADASVSYRDPREQCIHARAVPRANVCVVCHYVVPYLCLSVRVPSANGATSSRPLVDTFSWPCRSLAYCIVSPHFVCYRVLVGPLSSCGTLSGLFRGGGNDISQLIPDAPYMAHRNASR